MAKALGDGHDQDFLGRGLGRRREADRGANQNPR